MAQLLEQQVWVWLLVLFEPSTPTRLMSLPWSSHWLVKSSLGFAQCVEPQLSGSVAALHAGGPEFVLFDMEQ